MPTFWVQNHEWDGPRFTEKPAAVTPADVGMTAGEVARESGSGSHVGLTPN
jgi:hypothetical protein